ncbi:cysteine hydrolase family protein [Actinokineospora spheciospongiae]|uniref:cysteine hydrolase family protein n=1 Tax=Actinokineospora spheciospongiae TaxID=909613 RepID=UPI0015E86F4F|nr:isochorismatase family cysteine hydrolase [Actinokineospora spheciospongiae]
MSEEDAVLPGSALLVLDLMNDLVHPDGKKAGEGYHRAVDGRGVLDRAATAVERARAAGIPVVYVVIGFEPGYADWPAASPLFRARTDDDKPTLGTWGTTVHDRVAPRPGEPVVVKRRVSPFHGTHLDLLLRGLGVDTVLLTGVATELVVLSAAREAHDRDYRVRVLADATATGDPDVHEWALRIIARTAEVTTVDAALPPADAR